MLTTTDYIGIGVLMTTFTTGVVQIINTIRLKTIHTMVNSNSTAQDTLIAALQARLDDKNLQINDARQIAAVLASGRQVRAVDAPVSKLDVIAHNTEETVKAVKDIKK